MDAVDGARPSCPRPSSATSSNHSTPTLPRRASSLEVITGVNQFGLDVFRHHSKRAHGNLIISPRSFTIALQIIGLGASGATKSQIENALGGAPLGNHFHVMKFTKRKSIKHILENSKAKILKRLGSVDGPHHKSQDDSPPQEKHPYHVVNKIFVKKGKHVEKAFTDQAESLFDAKTKDMDFAGNVEKCREDINKWVSKHTNGRIKTVVTEDNVTPATSLIIVNCIYFKGDWENKFDPSMTQSRPFYTGTDTRNTDFMFRKDTIRYHVNEKLKCRAVELPYVGNELSFVVILPDSPTGLDQLEKNLTKNSLHEICSNMEEFDDLIMFLPKFRMSTNVELSESFDACGIRDLFSESRADLRGIEAKGALYVSGIAHKVFIEVNEEGCEAAAVTCEVLRAAGGGGPPPTVFDAKHPFLFMVKENSKHSVVFMGKFCSPSDA